MLSQGIRKILKSSVVGTQAYHPSKWLQRAEKTFAEFSIPKSSFFTSKKMGKFKGCFLFSIFCLILWFFTFQEDL